MDHQDDRELSRKVSDDYRRVGPPDDGAKSRLMARLRRGAGVEPRFVSWLRGEWLHGPWTPGATALAALTTMVIGTTLGWVLHERMKPVPPPAPLAPGMGDASATREVRLVQFVLAAPSASQVTVVGDFNGWDPHATPMARSDGGAWTAAIPVAPGRHVYAFIVDGARWVSDPAAPLAPEDGFGIRNSVIVVGGQEST